MRMEPRLLPQYLIRAEQFMLENRNRDIMLSDIAEAAACNERALVRIFEEYREMHPMAVLETLRSFD